MDTTRRSLITAGLVAGAGLALQATSAAAQPAKQPGGLTKFQVVLFDGFEVTDALAPFDVLKIASHVGAPFEVELVTVNDAEEVTALDGVRVKRTARLNAAGDVLVVPGAPALWRGGGTPPGLESAVRAWRSAGKTLATVCTGAVFIARMGLLANRNANTHRAAHDVIKQLGANLIQARVVDDGDLLSSAGVTSGIDLAIYLVERYAGPQLAFATEQVVEHERRGSVWRAS